MKRGSTIIRNNQVHILYEKIKSQYKKDVFNSLSKSFIYGEISNETGLCIKTIANILNKTKKEN